MHLNYYILLIPVWIELIGYILYGPYTFNTKIIDSLLLNQKIGINQYAPNMISIYHTDKANIVKTKDNFLWQWYLIKENGKKVRVFRWTKASKYLDKIYSELKNK